MLSLRKYYQGLFPGQKIELEKNRNIDPCQVLYYQYRDFTGKETMTRDRKIRLHSILPHSLTDGPGDRTVVFFQGCPIRCPGCQSPHTHDPQGGKEFFSSETARTVIDLQTGNPAVRQSRQPNFTISGGEPFDQAAGLLSLLQWIHDLSDYEFYAPHVIIYTGYTWEFLEKKIANFREIVTLADILVDGQFVRELDDNFMQWAGSRNQRPIKTRESIETGQIMVDDWTTPQVTISATGNAIFPFGLTGELAEIGKITRERNCGNSKCNTERKPRTQKSQMPTK